MDFEGAQRYLDKFVSHEKSRDVSLMKHFDLDMLTRFLDEWCVGWKNVKYFHVGGSKGKGTVCTLISDYLTVRRVRVGRFLSPHVLSVCERIAVCSEDIDEENFAGLVGEFANFIGDNGCNLSWFEILFVLSLKYFVASGCEYVVLEVGLGGRLDATNVVKPLVTVLTGVEMEHADVLGDTIEKIFEEKWGIAKPSVPMVCSESLRQLVGEREASFVDGNAGLARMALLEAGFEVDEEVFTSVMANFEMIGRFEVRGNVVFDMAHTVESMKQLLKKMDVFGNRVFLVGMLRDKDKDGVLEVLKDEEVVFVGGFSDRAMDGEDFESAYERLQKTDQVLVVTGSSYLVGKVLKLQE